MRFVPSARTVIAVGKAWSASARTVKLMWSVVIGSSLVIWTHCWFGGPMALVHASPGTPVNAREARASRSPTRWLDAS